MKSRASSKKGERDAVLDLVAYFHERSGQRPGRMPTARELQQARALLTEHDFEQCRYAVDFALQSAEETRFRMRHFGAVLSYVSDALNARERHLEMKRRRTEEERVAREHEKELAAQRAADEAMSPQEKVERDLERWRLFFPALHKNRKPTSIEIDQKRRELELQHGIVTHDADRRSLTG